MHDNQSLVSLSLDLSQEEINALVAYRSTFVDIEKVVNAAEKEILSKLEKRFNEVIKMVGKAFLRAGNLSFKDRISQFPNRKTEIIFSSFLDTFGLLKLAFDKSSVDQCWLRTVSYGLEMRTGFDCIKLIARTSTALGNIRSISVVEVYFYTFLILNLMLTLLVVYQI